MACVVEKITWFGEPLLSQMEQVRKQVGILLFSVSKGFRWYLAGLRQANLILYFIEKSSRKPLLPSYHF